MALMRRLVLGSLAAALAAGLTGCATPGDTTRAAVTVENFAEIVAAGQADLDPVSCTFSMTSTVARVTLTGSGAMQMQADGTPAMTMTMTVPDAGEAEMRLVGGLIYMNMGELTGGKWVALDPADATIGMPELPEIDPARDVADLAPALVSVTEVGAPESLDGVEVRQYKVVVDLAKVTGTMREQLDKSLATLRDAGAEVPTELTYHYWLGADGLPRKMSVDVADTQTEMTFADWGKPVEVLAPAADEVVELSQIGQ